MVLKNEYHIRDEKQGWCTIMPLSGNREADTTLFNPSAIKILEELKEGKSPQQIVKLLTESNPEEPY